MSRRNQNNSANWNLGCTMSAALGIVGMVILFLQKSCSNEKHPESIPQEPIRKEEIIPFRKQGPNGPENKMNPLPLYNHRLTGINPIKKI